MQRPRRVPTVPSRPPSTRTIVRPARFIDPPTPPSPISRQPARSRPRSRRSRDPSLPERSPPASDISSIGVPSPTNSPDGIYDAGRRRRMQQRRATRIRRRSRSASGSRRRQSGRRRSRFIDDKAGVDGASDDDDDDYSELSRVEDDDVDGARDSADGSASSSPNASEEEEKYPEEPVSPRRSQLLYVQPGSALIAVDCFLILAVVLCFVPFRAYSQTDSSHQGPDVRRHSCGSAQCWHNAQAMLEV